MLNQVLKDLGQLYRESPAAGPAAPAPKPLPNMSDLLNFDNPSATNMARLDQQANLLNVLISGGVNFGVTCSSGHRML